MSEVQVSYANGVFTLSCPAFSYVFHVHSNDANTNDGLPTGELVHDHYGGPLGEAEIAWKSEFGVPLSRCRREMPDLGRGDQRIPGVRLRDSAGNATTAFRYDSHRIFSGSKSPATLPATAGAAADCRTSVVTLRDDMTGVEAQLNYTIFPSYSAIVRSIQLVNKGSQPIQIEKLASWSLDMERSPWESIYLCGDHEREGEYVRKSVARGSQGFQNAAGYSSHFYNPFAALVHPDTTETAGIAYGFCLVYSGSHQLEVETSSHWSTRIVFGMNPSQSDWRLDPGESFSSPECVSVFSSTGIGSMRRSFHSLFRKHLSRSRFTMQTRPVSLNHWEGLYFDFDANSSTDMASSGADSGVRLFVMDDGWFGNGDTARIDDTRGLGDWVVNSHRFPNGLAHFVDRINQFSDGKLQFGIWVEPEMVNPASDLYNAHPNWVLQSPGHMKSLHRSQSVLDSAQIEVQDYIISWMTKLLDSANIQYVKWDNNRTMHEMAHPSAAHRYILGLYRVSDTSTSRFPDVSWEGCASGGGRSDAGMSAYFCQTWTSDNTDPVERLRIQFNTMLAYPASSLCCHISASPNHQTMRSTPLLFRAHVAMMGGSFGSELDPRILSLSERKAVREIITTAEDVNPIVIEGDAFVSASPNDSNWPAMQYLSSDRSRGVLFAFQINHASKQAVPRVYLQSLDPTARYSVGAEVYSGAFSMNHGLAYRWNGDYQSDSQFISRV